MQQRRSTFCNCLEQQATAPPSRKVWIRAWLPATPMARSNTPPRPLRETSGHEQAKRSQSLSYRSIHSRPRLKRKPQASPPYVPLHSEGIQPKVGFLGSSSGRNEMSTTLVDGQLVRIVVWAVLALVFFGLAAITRRNRLRREAREREADMDASGDGSDKPQS